MYGVLLDQYRVHRCYVGLIYQIVFSLFLEHQNSMKMAFQRLKLGFLCKNLLIQVIFNPFSSQTKFNLFIFQAFTTLWVQFIKALIMNFIPFMTSIMDNYCLISHFYLLNHNLIIAHEFRIYSANLSAISNSIMLLH